MSQNSGSLVRQVCVGVFALLGSLAASAATTTFTSADVEKADHPAVGAVTRLGEMVSQRTGGQLAIQVRPNAELGNETQVLDKLRNGTLDMARVNLGVLADLSPAAKLTSLPYLFRSREHMTRVLHGDFGKRLEKELAASNLVLLMYLDTGARNFYGKKPIRSRDDFKGMHVRVQSSPVYKDLITSLGGAPVVVQYDKVADAFKSGEIDAAENNLVSFVSSGHYLQARYLSIDEHSMVPDVLVMSKKAWGSLKPEQQEVLRTSATEAGELASKVWQDKEREALEIARKNGVTVITKSQLSMTGIESFATRLYNKYVADPDDLGTVLNILAQH
jgi:tripartite ATP-independent transporter DctP family solute receptor